MRLAHIEVPALVLWGATLTWISNLGGAPQPVFQVSASKLLLRPDIFHKLKSRTKCSSSLVFFWRECLLYTSDD